MLFTAIWKKPVHWKRNGPGMFKPCLVIPIYNNKDTIENVLDRVADYGLPVLIVNDGSDDATRQVLNSLEAEREPVRVKHLPQNGGKGAAVKAGLLLADSLGYSHALQVDADGQHQLTDIPKFLETAKETPTALVLGAPIFGEDVPKSRLYGRQISRFWVRVETLSQAIRDPLFGFRVYPVPSAAALIRRKKSIGNRMDFDPEIAVRLCWTGLPVRNINTPVIYPEGGVSNFRMVLDNVLISWLHTRLVCGMLLRLPRLLFQRVRG